MSTELTAERVRELFNYNPETGALVRKVSAGAGSRAVIGHAVGTKTGNGYLQVCIDHKAYGVHRLVFLWSTGRWPKDMLDHINHDKTDNRLGNLREVGSQENTKNTRMLKNNTSGVCGVYYCKRRDKWKACISLGGRNKHLGSFEHFQDAVEARAKANLEYGFHKNHGKELAHVSGL